MNALDWWIAGQWETFKIREGKSDIVKEPDNIHVNHKMQVLYLRHLIALRDGILR